MKYITYRFITFVAFTFTSHKAFSSCVSDSNWPQTQRRITELKQKMYCSPPYSINECREALGLVAGSATTAALAAHKAAQTERLNTYMHPQICDFSGSKHSLWLEVFGSPAWAAAKNRYCDPSSENDLKKLRALLTDQQKKLRYELEIEENKIQSAKSDARLNKELTKVPDLKKKLQEFEYQRQELEYKIENEKRIQANEIRRVRSSGHYTPEQQEQRTARIAETRANNIKSLQIRLDETAKKVSDTTSELNKIEPKLKALQASEARVSELKSQIQKISEHSMATRPNALGRIAQLDKLETTVKELEQAANKSTSKADRALAEAAKKSYSAILGSVDRAEAQAAFGILKGAFTSQAIARIAKGATVGALSIGGNVAMAITPDTSRQACHADSGAPASWVSTDENCRLSGNRNDSSFTAFLFGDPENQRDVLSNPKNCSAFLGVYEKDYLTQTRVNCHQNGNFSFYDDTQKFSYSVIIENGQVKLAHTSGQYDGYDIAFSNGEIKSIQHNPGLNQHSRYVVKGTTANEGFRGDALAIAEAFERHKIPFLNGLHECSQNGNGSAPRNQGPRPVGER